MSLMPTDFAHTRWGYVYDGDQHVHEPRDFWFERLPARYRDRAPRAVAGPDGKDYYRSANGAMTMVTDMRTAIAGVSELDWRFGPYSFDDIRSAPGRDRDRMRLGSVLPRAER